MPIYIVKTINDRNLLISADSFEFHAGEYSFARAGKKVARVPFHNVFAVIEESAQAGDIYVHDESTDESDSLLNRAANLLIHNENLCADYPEFWYDYYAYTGKHMILTEDGWDDGGNKPYYAPYQIIEEINAPEDEDE